MRTAARIAAIALLLTSVGCLLLLHVLRSDLDPIEARLSEYAIGPYGALMTTAFLAMGLALIALSLLIGASGNSAGVQRLVAPLIALAGVGLILSGIFETATGSPVIEVIHSRASATSVLALTAAAVASSTRRASGRSGAVARVITLVAVVAVAISPILHDTPWSGIGQRVVWLALAAWLLITAWQQSTPLRPVPTMGELMSTDRGPAIVVENLARRFGDLVAVDHVNFSVGQGEVFGFLGPNGAGKTTTIAMLTTLLRPTEGSARVAGHDVGSDAAGVRETIGIVFQEPSLDERLTARENLEFHAVLYGMRRAERATRIDAALRLVELEDRANHLVEQYSGGMRRRLEIARGLLHVPAVLFLDEPTLGLDPQSRRSVWEHIRALRDETGVTIFMTTHYMEEAEFCDRIAIIDHGRIVALDTPEGLKNLVGGDVVTVTAPDSQAMLDYLAEHSLHGSRRDSEVRIEVDDGARFIPRLVRGFPGEIDGASLRRPTLDDVFLKLTGRTIRESELDAGDVARGRMRRAMGIRGRR
jgi:ABC-2 type transport system ATP-binding protein